MKPKFPFTPGAEGLPSPAAGGAGELWGEQPNLPCPVQCSTGCSSHAGKCFFSFDIAANEDTRIQGLAGGRGCEWSAADGDMTCGAQRVYLGFQPSQ